MQKTATAKEESSAGGRPSHPPTKKSYGDIDLLKQKKSERSRNAGQANAMLGSSITLHKVIEGVELIIC